MSLSALVALVAWALTGPQVVIMGDSYASGTGTGEYSDEMCMRSAGGIEHSFASLGVEVRNVACNGAHISHLLGSRNVVGYTRHYESGRAMLAESARQITDCSWPLAEASRRVSVSGLSVSCEVDLAPQIEAITPDTTDVVLTIGGNNLGFGHIAAYCVALRGPLCEDEVADAREKIQPAIAQLEHVIEVVQADHPHVRIHLTTYPELTDEAELAVVGEEWNEAVSSLARDGVNIVSYPSLVGHLHEDLPDFMHPTTSGWRLMSQALVADIGEFLAKE